MNKNPKIALVVPNILDSGGVSTVAAFIKDVIIRSGRYDIKVISLSSSSVDPESMLLAKPSTWFRGPVVSDLKWQGLSVHHVGAWAGEIEFVRYQHRGVLAKETEDCDLIQVVCGTPVWGSPMLGLGKPVSVHFATLVQLERKVRDENSQTLSDYWRKFMTRFTNYYDNRVLRHADAIQSMNSHMQAYAQRLSKTDNADIRLAPPGINIEKYKPAADRNFLDGGYILTVSRLSDPRKNLGLLLKAYDLLSEETKSRVNLVLAGSSEPPDSFWKLADVLGLRHSITYIEKPSLNELIELYQGARVFCIPSAEEGFGMVVIEAMACGVPVVSTLSGGPDCIISDGFDGYLVPLNDSKLMSERLESLISDDLANLEMGRMARSKIERIYSLENAGKVFLDIWDKLLVNSRK